VAAPRITSSNAQLTRHAFEWFNANRNTFIEIVHPDVEISVASTAVTGGVPFRGHAGFQRWVATMEESFEVWELCPQTFEERDNSVLVLGSMCVRGRGSGVELNPEMGWIVDVKDGKLLRLRSFTSHAAAREAFERGQ